MPGGITTFGSGAWLSAIHGLTGPITEYWVALALAEPGVDMDGTILASLEPPSGSGYTRASIAVNATNFASDGQYLTSQVDLDFPFATADWGLPTFYALCDAATGGDIYCWGQLGDAYYIPTSYGAVIPAGGIAIVLGTLDAPIAV